MHNHGRIIVFEGVDGVGKTTLSTAIADRLDRSGERCILYAFPGRQPNTLGDLVYRLHHNQDAVVGGPVTRVALQALHIAAHIDAIERVLGPALSAGTTVVLDRFWWSTWAYGMADGLSEDVLDQLIAAERTMWQKIGHRSPDRLFVVQAEFCRSEHHLSRLRWEELRRNYDTLVDEQSFDCPVTVIGNDGPFEETVNRLMDVLS